MYMMVPSCSGSAAVCRCSHTLHQGTSHRPSTHCNSWMWLAPAARAFCIHQNTPFL